jgi:amidase
MTPAFGATMAMRMARNPRGDAQRAFRGTVQSHYAWMRADAERQEIREKWYEFFHQFDVVLMPVTPTPAPGHHNK